MIRDRLANRLADIAIYHRKAVFVLFGVLTVVSLALSGGISVITSTDEMLGEGNPAARRFREITDTFGSTGSLVVAVEGPDRASMIEAAHLAVERIEERDDIMQHVRAIDLTVDPEYGLDWGLMLADDVNDIENLQRLLEQRSLLEFVTAVNDMYEDVVLEDDERFATNQDEWDGAQGLAGIELFTRTVAASVSGSELPPEVVAAATGNAGSDPVAGNDRDSTGGGPAPGGAGREAVVGTAGGTGGATGEAAALVRTFFSGDMYRWSPDDELLTFTVQPNFPLDDLDATRESVYGLRDVAAGIEEEMDGIHIGIGGEIAQNQDEQDAASADMLVPALVALLLIVLLFAVSFARFRNIFFAILTLIVGILLTAGAIALTVGHLSFITSAFVVILIGLGIDFGIHLVSNFDDFRSRGDDPPTAIRKVMHAGGTPIILGGVTTAAAFFTLSVARMPAVTEFGIIAGLGVVLTLAATMILLPALMLSFGSKGDVRSFRRRFLVDYGFLAGVGSAISRHRRAAVIAILVITVLAATIVPANRVDYDMLSMGPSSGPAVDTQRTIMDRMEVSPFTALTTADSVGEARKTADALRRQSLVSRVASISDLLPPEEEIDERLAAIAATGPDGGGTGANGDAGSPPQRTPDDVQALADEIQRLEWNIIELGDLSVAGLGENNRVVRRRDAMIREIIGAEVGEPGREVFQNAIEAITDDPEASAGRLARIDAAFPAAMNEQQQRMQVDRAPTVADIPESIRANFVSDSGDRFLTTIVPVAQTHDSDEILLAYHDQISEVDPAVTGSVPLYVTLVDELFTDGAQAAAWAALVVFLVMMAIFRKPAHVLLAFGSVAVAIVWTFGILPLLGMELIAFVAVVFPLLIGIGTDFAMHILHRYDHEEGDIVSTLRFSGKAVLLSSVTTMLGFGSLALVGEIGAVSALGTLLFVGIGACLVATVIGLPAFLGLRKRS